MKKIYYRNKTKAELGSLMTGPFEFNPYYNYAKQNYTYFLEENIRQANEDNL